MSQHFKTLVTGTSGYLGSHISQILTKSGHKVFEVQGRKDFERKLKALANENFDFVIHAGFSVNFAPYRTSDISESVKNTITLLDFCRTVGNPHFIFLSAAGTLGVSKTPRARDEDQLGFTDSEFKGYFETEYIQDKISCESYLSRYEGKKTILYLTTVYGKNMHPETLGNIKSTKSLSPLIPCPPGGTSFLSLNDFLRALKLALDRGIEGKFVLSSGNTSYAHLYKSAAKTLGVSYRKMTVKLPQKTRPLVQRVSNAFPKHHLTTAVLESTFGYKYYSCHRAQQFLGWTPQDDLASALKEALGEASP